MQFESPLTRGTLIRRYKRFLADVELEHGEVVVAHCANSGSMMGLADEGKPVWLSPNQNPKAKLDWRWEMVEVGQGENAALVGINTSRPNRIVEEAIAEGQIPELTGYESMRREVKYGQNSRIDLLLFNDSEPTHAPTRPPNKYTGVGASGGGVGRPCHDQQCYVEIKNVTLKRDGFAEFPDAVTARGAKHLAELADMVDEGHRAVMFYLVNRGDCEGFRLAEDIDPTYAEAFKDATARGVEVLVYQAELSPEGIEIGEPLPASA